MWQCSASKGVSCPLHGSQFNVRPGAALRGPAKDPLKTYRVMFPVLSSAQIARIASLGVIRPITRGEVLIDGGQTNVPFFVLKAGEIEVIRPSALEEILVAVVGPSQFTGDISMILDRPAQMRLSVGVGSKKTPSNSWQPCHWSTTNRTSILRSAQSE